MNLLLDEHLAVMRNSQVTVTFHRKVRTSSELCASRRWRSSLFSAYPVKRLYPDHTAIQKLR